MSEIINFGIEQLWFCLYPAVHVQLFGMDMETDFIWNSPHLVTALTPHQPTAVIIYSIGYIFKDL